MALALKPMAVLGLLKEARLAAGNDKPIAVGGALTSHLRSDLVAGGKSHAVREGGPKDAALYVHVLGMVATDEDERALKEAHRARVPTLVLAREGLDVPYVLATDVVVVPPGAGFPLEALAGAIAGKLGEAATPLAAALPVLRKPVCDQLIRLFSRRNGLIGAAVFLPGVDLPALTLNQIRLVLRIGAAYGEEIGNERLPEVLAIVGSALGLRLVARELLGAVPVAGWAIKGAVAFAGTRALGEAAVRYFEARAAGAGPPAS